MKKRSILVFFSLLLGAGLLFTACKKEEPLPANPYDNVVYGNDTTTVTPPDPTSFVGIHQNILSVKCNNPGCHDGSFEPDFRTVQSAWSTLVYHGIVKNTPDSAYAYRVIPYDTGSSILWRRITRGNEQLQRMPATGATLSAEELSNIRTWIENGARDMFGSFPEFPNSEPQIIGYVALDLAQNRLDLTENRVDSIFFNPFYVPQNTTFNLAFFIEDDSTEMKDLKVNTLRLSSSKNDFSQSIPVNATYFTAPGIETWLVTLSTSLFSVGDTLYFRYYVNDGDQASDTEFPKNETIDPYKTFYAFTVKN